PERLNKSWSRFWTTPAVTALPETFPGGYDGAMLDFWEEQLDGEFGHIVDLATGNGALVWIACDIQKRRDKPARVTGVDLADIDPFTVLNRSPDEYPAVSFIGNTSVDALPFADHSVDVVISQYGIEYSDLEKTIAEIARVLTLSGKMCFILHDRDSVIVRGMTNKLTHCNDLIADHEFHDLTGKFIALQGRFASTLQLQASVEYQTLGGKLYQKLLQLKPRLDQYPRTSPLNAYIQSWSVLTNPATDLTTPEREQQANTALAELIAGAEKLAEVKAAALTSADREALARFIGQHGFKISRFEALEYNDGRNWGTKLVAQR
ncbi:MAG: class I SAM-dependent methyltransferase, partial [Gammaproteobacteria bacterium]|nr:class I SAM-dependent methyltransferase [Gammaproteobacteria bacterium]